jgi:hypothetical protein
VRLSRAKASWPDELESTLYPIDPFLVLALTLCPKGLANHCLKSLKSRLLVRVVRMLCLDGVSLLSFLSVIQGIPEQQALFKSLTLMRKSKSLLLAGAPRGAVVPLLLMMMRAWPLQALVLEEEVAVALVVLLRGHLVLVLSSWASLV